MTWLTVPRPPKPPGAKPAVSHEGSECPVLAPLDPFLYQRMRWCEKRRELQIFVEVFEGEFGRLGVCLGCGDERVIPFSRANSEAC